MSSHATETRRAEPGPGTGGAAAPVVVTGAGGFIGSHLARALVAEGRRVIAIDLHLDRLRHLEEPGRLDLVEGDVVDPRVHGPAFGAAETVFHLAAAHLGASLGDDEFWRVNVRGLRTLIESARVARVRRFVHTSSVGVYGDLRETPADEDSECRPQIAYEITKLEGEKVVQEAIRDGFPAVILRPAWVYGPGCPRTEKLFRTIGKGRFLVAGKGDSLRHCVYIDDMTAAFRLAVAAERALGQVIVIGDAEPVTIRRLVDTIAKLTGAPRPRSIPLPLVWAAGLALETLFAAFGKEPPVSRRTLKFFTGNTAFRIDRARDLLGWEPRWDLATGMAETHQALQGARPWRISPVPS
jgi:nucleoside-diphosphate-sugar epimerase